MGLSAVNTFSSYGTRTRLGAHRQMCSCPACSKKLNSAAQAIAQPPTNPLQGLISSNTNAPQAYVYPLPSPEDLQNDPTIQQVEAEQPYELTKKGEGNAPPCISSSARKIPANDQNMLECFDKKQVEEDLRIVSANGYQVEFLYDPVTHNYIQIQNQTGSKLPLARLISLVNQKDWVRAYINGVREHEELHQRMVRHIPDAVVEKYEQGIKITISGTVTEPKFEVSTFGQSVFDASKIDNGVDEAENFFNQAQSNFQKGQQNNFANWSDQTFSNLINNLKAYVSKLQFYAQETLTLALAAVAPLTLHDTIYYEHETLSKADKERYQEANQLRDYILNLVNNIQNFIGQVQQAWSSKSSNSTNRSVNNIVPLVGQAAAPNRT